MHAQKHPSVLVQRFGASAGIPYSSQNQGVRRRLHATQQQNHRHLVARCHVAAKQVQ